MAFVPVDINAIKLDAPEQPKGLPSRGRTVLEQGLQGTTFNLADEVYDRLGAGIAGAAQKDVLGRTADDIRSAGAGARKAWGRSLSGDLNPAMAGVQILGEGAKAAVALPTQLMSSALDAVPDVISKPVGQAIGAVAKPIMNAPDQFAGMLDKTSYGQKLGDFLMNAGAGKTLQDIGDTAKAAANIVTAVPITKASGYAIGKAGEASKAVGGALEKSGQAALAGKKKAFITDLITPKDTPSVRGEQFVKGKEKGLLRQLEVEPDKAIVDAIGDLPIKNSNSLKGNYTIIENAKNAEAESLIAALEKANITVPDDTILSTFSNVRNELAKNPYIVGDGAKAADNVLNSALDIVANNPRTAAGLLQSRKQLDGLIASQRGSKMFDPALESPITNAVQQVRQSINQMVADAVPDAQVKASLAKQSAMYRALDNIETKGAFEKTSRLGRAGDKISKAVTLKGAIGGAAALGGAGMAGLVTPAVLPMAAAGAGLYAASKIPARRIAGGALRRGGELAEKAGSLGNYKDAIVGSSLLGAKAGGFENEAAQLPAPMPQPALDFNDLIPQQQVGPQSSLTDRIGQAESSGNPNAKNPLSTASGLYQFTDDTWRSAVNKWGRKYGVSAKDKNNPEAQTAMVNELLADNARILKAKGIEPTDANLYFAHFMGAPAAAKAMTLLGKNAIAARSFPQAAGANPKVFFDGRRPRTVDEVYELITSKVV